uniref:AlNc14C154G7592 protein n=1 Tax=Albugo laibachii Nc14 TaxID=890382 RepID=F0WM87_9STRA|nr:AlNc14C154G7592 [Albugo laibachii Nc14]|eukprot:CCA22417.1 AlNc14C154G7592 [Albugo laibachii Nc14]
MNQRRTTQLLTPPKMRRVGGGYAPIRASIQATTRPSVPAAGRSAELAHENTSLKEENSALKQEVQMLKGMLTVARDAFASQGTSYNQALEERTSLEQRLAQCGEIVASQKERINELSLQLKAAACKRKEESSRFRKVEAELQMAKSRLSEVKHQLELAPTRSVIIIPAPKSFLEVSDEIQCTSFSQKLIKTLKNENQGLQNQIIELLATNGTLQRQIRRLSFVNSKHPIGSLGSRNS